MSYKHIIGDLYEFKEMTTGDRTSIRLSKVEQFEAADGMRTDHLVTTLEMASGDHISLSIAYEDFKELMKLYIEQEMAERARMSYPICVPSVWEPEGSNSYKYEKTDSKWVVTSDGPTQLSGTSSDEGEKE